MAPEVKLKKKKRVKNLSKGQKALNEIATKGRARPLIINVSPDTAKKLSRLLNVKQHSTAHLGVVLAQPPKWKGIEEGESDSSLDDPAWDPCWLEVIYELAARYATEAEIVAYLPFTYMKWLKLKNDPSTRIRDVLEAARASGIMFLKSKFRSKVDEGDTRAIIFGLRTQAGWREDGLGSQGSDGGENQGSLTGAVDRLLAKSEAAREPQ